MVAFVATSVAGILKFDAFSAVLNVDSIEKRGILLISTVACNLVARHRNIPLSSVDSVSALVQSASEYGNI